MRRYTIEELQQMRESEDHVEFKKGEHGIVSYNGADKQFFLMYSNRLKDSNNLLD